MTNIWGMNIFYPARLARYSCDNLRIPPDVPMWILRKLFNIILGEKSSLIKYNSYYNIV